MHPILSISVTGADAFEFLQAQLTNDLRPLESGVEILAAWCNPKGRVIWFGTVGKTADGYRLSAPAATAEDIVKRLSLFRFRAKVDFEVVDEGQTVDPAFLVEHGHPYIGREQMELFTPHMLNLDLLDAISMDKGCYPGQEIVARTHYKGATKRRLQRFACEGTPAVGEKVSDGERDIGEVLNVAGSDLLAVVPLDKVEAPLFVSGASLHPKALPYL